jgi:predicted dehydrogenase
METTRFGIIGTGWRSEFYLRIARELPQHFQVVGVVSRQGNRAQEWRERWNVPTFASVQDLLKDEKPDFVVVSVPRQAVVGIAAELVGLGVPMLLETPPAPDLAGLVAINRLTAQDGRIQVAEQYHRQPLHAARLALAGSGRLGDVVHVQISCSHDYHGISLLRRALGLGFENATIRGSRLSSTVLTPPNRGGYPDHESYSPSSQEIAVFDFGAKTGVYDFTGDQYFSPIRTNRMLVRGTRGEIHDTQVTFMADHKTPIEWELRRQNAGENGNLEGYHLKGILAGDQWVYRNPFSPGRLADDEIAVADCLAAMHAYALGGADFYSLAEASQDHYLGLLMKQALDTGAPVRSGTQPWAAP